VALRVITIDSEVAGSRHGYQVTRRMKSSTRLNQSGVNDFAGLFSNSVLSPGGSVGRRWVWFDPVAKSRVRGC
jgi:hypothetical protein